MSATDNAAEPKAEAYAGETDLSHELLMDQIAGEIQFFEHDMPVAPIKLYCLSSARSHSACSALRAAAIAHWPFRAPRRNRCS